MTKRTPEMMSKMMEDSADTVTEAMDQMQDVATRLETNVADGIQPDVREMRQWLTALDEKADLRLKRMTWALWGLAALNAVVVLLLAVK